MMLKALRVLTFSLVALLPLAWHTPSVFAQNPDFSMQECIQSGKSQQQCFAECWASGRSESLCEGWQRSTNANLPEEKIFVDGVEKAYLDPKDVNAPAIHKLTMDDAGIWVSKNILGGMPQPTADGGISYSPGLVGSMGNYIALMMTNPPANTQRYVADVMNSAGVAIAQPAYAQGIGFASLDPILSTWKIFRNVAYFFFIIVIVVIGFMIMFRQKIQGQTVVTAQQAIPSIIVALVSVTFSYALAGLLIDIMYILMYLLAGLFTPANAGTSGFAYTFIQDNIFEIGLKVFTDSQDNVNHAINDLVTGLSSSLVGSDAASALGFLGGITFVVIFAVALAIGIFRLFFVLLRTYLEIIISIVTAPLILMLGALPGRNTFGPWLKNLFGLLATFPVVLLTLIVFKILSTNYTTSTGGFLPPFMIGQGNSNAIATLIGMGFILIMPEIVKQAQKALGVSEGGVFKVFGQAIGDAVKKGWSGDEELIPGLAFTKPGRYGLSGKGITRTAAVGATGAAGLVGAAVGGGVYGATRKGGIPPSMYGDIILSGGRIAARTTADATGSGYFKTNRKAREEIPLTSPQRRIKVMATKEGK